MLTIHNRIIRYYTIDSYEIATQLAMVLDCCKANDCTDIVKNYCGEDSLGSYQSLEGFLEIAS